MDNGTVLAAYCFMYEPIHFCLLACTLSAESLVDSGIDPDAASTEESRGLHTEVPPDVTETTRSVGKVRAMQAISASVT